MKRDEFKMIKVARAFLLAFVIWNNCDGQSDERCRPEWFVRDDREIGLQNLSSVTNLRRRVVEGIWSSDAFPGFRPEMIAKREPIMQLNGTQTANGHDLWGSLYHTISTVYSYELNLEWNDGLWRTTPTRSVEVIQFKLGNKPEFSPQCQCRCDRLGPWFNSNPLAFHFFNPVYSNGHGVVIHQGHANSIEAHDGLGKPQFNFQPLIDSLVGRGYHVMFVFMPQMNPLEYGGCGYDPSGNCHSCLLKSKLRESQMNELAILRLFLEQSSIAIGFMQNINCKIFHMIGLSGGGWATTLYAALDTRITSSFSVDSGLWPRYMSSQIPGDFDYGAPLIYDNIGVQQMYVLGSLGDLQGRRSHTEVFIKKSVSNGEANYYASDFYNPYKPRLNYLDAINELRDRVKRVINRFGGDFDLIVDDTTEKHQISDFVRDSVILRKLKTFERQQ